MQTNKTFEEQAFQIQSLEFTEALGRIGEYQYAVIFLMSERIVGPAGAIQNAEVADRDELPDFYVAGDANRKSWEECIEARFFSEDKELHIFRQDGQFRAVAVQDGPAPLSGKNIKDKEYELVGNLRHLGRKIIVREYLNYDEDGQMVVELTRLKGIE